MTKMKRTLLIGGVAIGVAAVLGVPRWWSRYQADVQAEACIHNLRQIGLAGRIVAATNGNAFPRDFTALRPHIRPEFLICPSDKQNTPTTWSGFDFGHITYEMVGAGMSQVTDYSNVFVRCRIHHFKCYGDGWAPPRHCKGQGEE